MNILTLPLDERKIIKNAQRDYPVALPEIAKALNIRVQYAPLDEKISGKLERHDDAWEILVNSNQHRNRQRFTIAHELAHYLLHRDGDAKSGVTDDVFYRSGLANKIEQEANKLAADILMPFNLINRLMDRGIANLDGLAEKLQVSKLAMAIRLGIPTL